MTSLGMEMLHDVRQDVIAADYLLRYLHWFKDTKRAMPPQDELALRRGYPRLTMEGVASIVSLMKRFEALPEYGCDWMNNPLSYELVMLKVLDYVGPMVMRGVE